MEFLTSESHWVGSVVVGFAAPAAVCFGAVLIYKLLDARAGWKSDAWLAQSQAILQNKTPQVDSDWI